MATYFESGVGKAVLHVASDNSVELGRLAASQALSQIKRFQPCLAFAFLSPEMEVSEVTEGVMGVLGDCPLIGASTAGEIAKLSVFFEPRHSLSTAEILSKSHTGIWRKFGGLF